MTTSHELFWQVPQSRVVASFKDYDPSTMADTAASETKQNEVSAEKETVPADPQKDTTVEAPNEVVEKPFEHAKQEEAPAETVPTETKTEDTKATAPAETTSKKPYEVLFASLETLIKEADYDEVYGVKLQPTGEHVPTQIIVQKFLRANANDIDKAKEQLLGTLKWRKEFNPLNAKDEAFSKERFDGLGYVIDLKDGQTVTFNVYGAVKDHEKTFKDLSG